MPRPPLPPVAGRAYSVVRDPVGDGFPRGGAAAALELCDFFEEAAETHAERLGCPIERLQRQGLTWVLLRLDIEVEPDAVWRGPLEVTTWPRATRRVFAPRDYLAAGGEGPIARATSTWCVLDLATRRPVGLPDLVTAIVPPDRPPALPHRVRRPPAPRRTERRETLRVVEADLDLNRHVNHVRTVRWALRTLPADWREEARFAGLLVEFAAEASLGDELVAEVDRGEPEDGRIEARHRIVRPGGEEVARMRSLWRPPR